MKAVVQTYRNPVIPGFFPDPSITRVGEDYYLVTSSFEYFPGVTIFHSKDLVHWRQLGHVLTRTSQLYMPDRKIFDGIYAPTLRYHKGRFYMITTDVRGIGNFYVWAEQPEGPWSEPILIPYGGIDPSLFFDDDGKVYVTVQNGADYESHAIQYEIDIATGQALTEPVVVFRGDGGPWCEGPHLYKIRGYYYLMASSGGTSVEHRVIIGRSAHPYGPFELLPHPILTHRGIKDHPIQSLGHADLIEDQHGNWWMVFLGVRPVSNGCSILGRETFLAPVQWSEDGWPMVDNNEGHVQLQMETDQLLEWTDRPEHGMTGAAFVREPFEHDELGPEWSFLRVPHAEEHVSLTERPGWLKLLGHAYTLQEAAPALFLCRRQQHHRMRASIVMEFAPACDGEEAGIAARLSDNANYVFGVLRKEGTTVLSMKLTDQGKTRAIEVPFNETGSGESRNLSGSDRLGGTTLPIHLAIECDGQMYRFLYRTASDAPWVTAGEAEAAALSPERNWCFTGVCLGIYATGNGKPSTTPAFIDTFEYTVLA